MISMVQALPAGNAIRLFVEPPAGAERWRLLRRQDANFADPFDPDATVVTVATGVGSILDFDGLVNGITYFYAEFACIRGQWSLASVLSAAPGARYGSDGADPLAVLRDRLECGLAVEVQRGAIKPSSGQIRVLTAPFATESGVQFPVVSVHLTSEVPMLRGIGEEMMPPMQDLPATDWSSYEGWVAQVCINIVAVSLNPDERIALRRALRRIVIVNLPVFDAAGMDQVTFSLRDDEDMRENAAPLFMAIGTFECLAPSFTSATAGAAVGISVTANGGHP